MEASSFQTLAAITSVFTAIGGDCDSAGQGVGHICRSRDGSVTDMTVVNTSQCSAAGPLGHLSGRSGLPSQEGGRSSIL